MPHLNITLGKWSNTVFYNVQPTLTNDFARFHRNIEDTKSDVFQSSQFEDTHSIEVRRKVCSFSETQMVLHHPQNFNCKMQKMPAVKGLTIIQSGIAFSCDRLCRISAQFNTHISYVFAQVQVSKFPYNSSGFLIFEYLWGCLMLYFCIGCVNYTFSFSRDIHTCSKIKSRIIFDEHWKSLSNKYSAYYIFINHIDVRCNVILFVSPGAISAYTRYLIGRYVFSLLYSH